MGLLFKPFEGSAMNFLSDMSKSELAKLVGKAQAELQRRNDLLLASKAIEKTLRKYSLSVADLHAIFPLKKGNADKKPVVSKKSRAPAAPKFFDPASDKRWSGRGRAPQWVKDVINKEGISLEEFKVDQRFLIKH